MRTFAIGDIHGSYRALVQVLERCGFDFKKDRLITLGDICDAYPDVKECVSLLLKIKNRIDLLGNHDNWFCTFLTTGIHPDFWKQGGRSTFLSYKLNKGWTIPKKHYDFFLRMKRYYIDEKNRLFVHAGFSPYQAVSKQPTRDLLWDRKLWDYVQGFKDKETVITTVEGFTKIFIGHTRVEGALPLKYKGVWNLDTGAGYAGKLTIMDVDTEEYWQSDFVKALYPDFLHGFDEQRLLNMYGSL